LRQASL